MPNYRLFPFLQKKNSIGSCSPCPSGQVWPQDNPLPAAGRSVAQGWCREEVTAALWHLEEGMSLFWVLLGAFPSQVVQTGPGGNPNLTSTDHNEKRSVEEKPQGSLAAPGVCADPAASGCPGSLPVEWVRAQPRGVPTHSRILMGPFQPSRFCASTVQSLPVPPSISWSHVCLPQVPGASWWLGWAQGAPPFISHQELQRGFSYWMDMQGKTQEEGSQTSTQGLGREALHPTMFPEGSWGLCFSSRDVAGEF